ncbi:MAG: fibrobacter succinogenes major paralogous domain-containing protein [Bacteroidia bacterium]|nr:fibrobacter succinogenes major paralogous domain-containing protein [Bacteroidia bacterium]
MKKIRRIGFWQIVIIGFVLLLTTSCNEIIDTSTPINTVTDIDGNVYHTVAIGTQVWMVENLKTTRFKDGSSIPNVTDNAAWSNLFTPGYCWHKNEITNKETYGALYNWFAISSGKLCPAGWHVPTDAEWTILIDYLGGESVAGSKLKEAGILHWQTPNTGATNESGIAALPGGYREPKGEFGPMAGTGHSGYFWSSNQSNLNNAWYRSLDYSEYGVVRLELYKLHGLSVRCIKD